MAIGAAFAGQLGVTATSGPGVDLKSEGLGLAVSLELPLVVVDVQRGGPSTGLPTKTEQADLLLAMYGRHGEAPLPIVAARSPSHCFDAAIEAVRLAVEVPDAGHPAHRRLPRERRPSRGGCPTSTTLPDLSVPFATEPNHDGEFWPYLRDPDTLARPWAIPGTPGLDAPHRRHREGGRHRATSTTTRRTTSTWSGSGPRRWRGIANDIPPVEVDDPDGAPLLVLGWGSTWGSIQQAVRQARDAGTHGRARPPDAPQPVPSEPR